MILPSHGEEILSQVRQLLQVQVIVAQAGARHNYAVPRMLHNQGLLSRLYTDFCLKGAAGSAATGLLGGFDFALAGNLRRRSVTGIPSRQIHSAPLVNVRSALARSMTAQERYALENEMLGRQMIRWGTGDANVVYGMYGSGLPFWRHAKARGLKIVVDVYITPLAPRIIAREREAFRDWEDTVSETGKERAMVDRLTRETIEVADLLLCPSPIVRDDLTAFADECSPPISTLPRTVVVPYGAPSGVQPAFRPKADPIAGRILFAGTADLRKGIHYLAKAAQSLCGARQGYEFRVAGQASERVRNHLEAQDLTFLGHLSRERMLEEYAKADVFVLPTLAEGSASVVYEALAAGVPVVTTRSAGSVVTHGEEGLIVPERDPDALAAAIETIVGDRSLRNEMAAAAIATAADFGEGPWGDRLVEVLATLVTGDAARRAPAMTPPQTTANRDSSGHTLARGTNSITRATLKL